VLQEVVAEDPQRLAKEVSGTHLQVWRARASRISSILGKLGRSNQPENGRGT
jgi:hypothetical protein